MKSLFTVGFDAEGRALDPTYKLSRRY